ncbi:hypothetical protein [Bifidobacterium tissieri]|uniref:Uncharacterized protein n=1 Tax=Bifidobacterium tissieri TaxID=1630162 RepID=A0A5M9ZVW2_9BIFI|nr:hypothetical protein [Bifidobacterium tissieri]KAA8829342.1 hypothetical protein EM849_11080 [Bifidobacterium tissieri]KAA8831655.1 hypothetical protein EMO89_02720 [Bifidobacterium tissieri]
MALNEIDYVSGTTGEVFDLEGDIMLGAALGLRSRDWAYSLGSRDIYSQVRKAREVTLSLYLYRMTDVLDRFMVATDADVRLSKPGWLRVYSEQPTPAHPSSGRDYNMWRQRAYIVKSESQSHYRSADPTVDLTVVLADGVWLHPVENLYRKRGSGSTSAYLDYPYDYPYDYAGMQDIAQVTNPDPSPAPVSITFYGPCTDPYVTVAGNTYQLNGVTVPAGSRVEVDGTGEPKSIVMISENGDRTDLFDKGVRGTGLDSGTYIFQPLPSGTHTISWSGGFDFTFWVNLQRSEPPWIS